MLEEFCIGVRWSIVCCLGCFEARLEDARYQHFEHQMDGVPHCIHYITAFSKRPLCSVDFITDLPNQAVESLYHVVGRTSYNGSGIPYYYSGGGQRVIMAQLCQSR